MCKLVRVPPVVKPPQFSQAVVRVLARQVVQRVAYKMHVAALPGRQIQKKILIVIAAEEDGAGIGRIRLHPIATVSGKPCDRVVVGEIGVATNKIDLFVAGCIEDDAAMQKVIMQKVTGNMCKGQGRALAVMAAYIDLNPVRAGMVDDPSEYRWSGYAEAVAGRKLAREGLRIAVIAAAGEEVVPQRVLAKYRCHLFNEGEEIEGHVPEAGVKKRRGFRREKVEEIIAAGGKLSPWELLRCRVRYFADGLLFGSQAFVERHFLEQRWRFSPKRESGARKLRHVQLPELYTARDLRVRVVG